MPSSERLSSFTPLLGKYNQPQRRERPPTFHSEDIVT